MFFLFTALATIAMGIVCLRRLDLPRSLGALALTSMLALCAQALVALVVGSLNLRAACGAVLAMQATALLIFFAGRPRYPILRLETLPRGGVYRIAAAATGIVFIATFISALAPITSWDATVAHIALPEAYVRLGRIALLDGNNYSAYPHLMHALFAVLMEGDKAPQSASLLVWGMGVIACAAIGGLGHRLHSRGTGVIAASILATAPIYADQASNPSIDLAYVAMVLCTLYGLLAWHQDKRTSWLVLAGLLAGCGCGVRHTAYLSAVLYVAGVWIAAPRARVRVAALFLSMTAVGALPWMLRTALIAGNPVYPFFASHFANTGMPDVDVAAVGAHSSLQGLDLAHFVTFPWSLTMNPAHFGGWSTSPGALWLILGLIGLFLGGRAARALGAFSGIGIAAIFFFQRFARYAFPFIAPMMVVAALPLEMAPRLKKLTMLALLTSFALGILPALATTATRFPVVAGLETRDNYLTRRIERYPAMQWVAQQLPMNAVVLTLDQRGYYLGHATHTNFEALKAIAPRSIDAQRDWLREHHIRYLFYPDAYVNESPAFRETGVLAMLDAWRADTQHFVLIKDFTLSNPRTGKTERVEIYDIRN